MTDYALAANFIEQFEGYTPVAKWDVNAYRLGYGSDTEGPDQIKVTKGMATTRERAFQNLEARIPAFEEAILRQVGLAPWGWLDAAAQAQAALLSVAYNYGDLPANVAYAVGKGETLALIASAVEAHEGDNHGVNKSRRLKEAQYIASAAHAPADVQSANAPPPVVATPADVQAKTAAEPVDVRTFAGVQEALNLLEKTLPPLAVDGQFGPQTVAKMKAFQASRGLQQAGDASFFSALAVYQALQKAGVPTVNPT